VRALADLLSQEMAAEPMAVAKPRARVLESPLVKTGLEPSPAEYERDVFNFLLAEKDSLGIKEVERFTGLRMDGAVQLADGRRLAIEIKYRMNWMKACQAGWQFSWFLKQPEAKQRPVDGGGVFFQEFAGDDWAKTMPPRLLQNGWTRWYNEHCLVDDLRLDLLRFSGGRLESFSDALAAARTALDHD
jgi:hypothetical protein